MPALVTISAHQKVGEAIDVMQRYSISQLPVVRDGELGTLADVIGSLQDRDLLDRVFKNADALHEDVASAMQPPLATVDAVGLGRRDRRRADGGHERGARRARRPAGRRRHALRPARVPRAHALAARHAAGAAAGRCARRRATRSPPPGWGAPPPSTASLTPPGGGLCNGSVPMRPQGAAAGRSEAGAGLGNPASARERARAGPARLAFAPAWARSRWHRFGGSSSRTRATRDASAGRATRTSPPRSGGCRPSSSTRSRPSTARTGSRSRSRIGALRRGGVSRLLRDGRVFEYWAHEACLLPIEDYALFKRRMVELSDHHWWGRERTAELRAVERDVLARIRGRGRAPGARVRGPQRADVGLEAGEARARAPVRRRRARDRRPAGLPARLRPARARDPARRSSTRRRRPRRVPPRLRAARRRGPRRADRVGDRRALPLRRRRAARSARTSTRSSPTGSSGGVEVDDGGPPVVVPAGASSRARRRAGRRRAALPVRQPDVGPAVPPPPLRLRPPDRGLQARARAASTATTCCRCSLGDRFVGRADLKADRARGVLLDQALHAGAGRPPPARRAARARRRTARALARPRRGRALTAPEQPGGRRDRRPGGRRIRSADGVRDPRDPRRPGARPGDRRGDHADLPDLDLRPGGGRAEQGLRLLARREPDPHGARDGAREPRGRRARHRVLVRARRDDDADAPRRPGRAGRADRRRLRRRLPDDLAGLRAEGLPLHLRPGRRVRREPRRATSTTTCAWSGSRRRRTRS